MDTKSLKEHKMIKPLLDLWWKHRLIRYLFSGGIGFVVNIGVLYLLTDVWGVWYALSGALAFIISITASFFLHRIFTFEYEKEGTAGGQYGGFLAVQILNLVINEGILVFSVEVLNLWYIWGQAIGSFVVAIVGYVVYRYVIFKEKSGE